MPERFLPELSIQPEKPENIESNRESFAAKVDTLALNAADQLQSIDSFILNTAKLPEHGGEVIEKLQKYIGNLEGKTSEELKLIMDPKGEYPFDSFSSYTISSDLPGVIHLELATIEDQKKFTAVKQGVLNGLISGDNRDVETFAAEYKPPIAFGGGEYLGVIVSVVDHTKDEKFKQGMLRHEYSHAITSQIIRPLTQHTIAAVDFTLPRGENCNAIHSLKESELDVLTEYLDVGPTSKYSENISKYFYEVYTASNIRNELFLLDELRAYTFSNAPLPPKWQLTDIILTGEDVPNSASKSCVEKYYDVYLLHVKARLTSELAQARSLAILGSSFSLHHAKKLLEQELGAFDFSSDPDGRFEFSINALAFILHSKQYMDFTFADEGSLVTEEKVRKVLVPAKDIVDQEIVRRWGSIDKTPEKFKTSYESIYKEN